MAVKIVVVVVLPVVVVVVVSVQVWNRRVLLGGNTEQQNISGFVLARLPVTHPIEDRGTVVVGGIVLQRISTTDGHPLVVLHSGGEKGATCDGMGRRLINDRKININSLVAN